MNLNCRKYLPLFLAALFFFLLLGCDDSSRPLIGARKSPPPSIAINNFQIPIFPTPDEQLNYTQSWFDSQDEKKAALLAVAQFFPDARIQRGSAALDLSYLLLGQDYRLATQEVCLKAIQNYQAIINEFHDLPEICVKAYWYMGWIFNDLLNDKKPGVEMFQIVVSQYPDVKMNMAPNVPWITIFPPVDSSDRQFQYANNQLWKDIALIQIIRHAEETDTVRKAFILLWTDHRDAQNIGIALRHILQKQELAREVAPFAREYLKEKTANFSLQNDIRTILSETHEELK